MKTLILASQSPRRQVLLKQLGLEFSVIPSDIEESFYENLSPIEMVQRLAADKAEAVALNQDGIIVAADTIVVLDHRIMGKPCSKEEAYAMLSALSGKRHQVITGVCVYNTTTQKRECVAEQTDVFFRALSDEEIGTYIASGEPFDKAGGYGIQGLGALLVEKIVGCYFNVVGLPLNRLGLMLKKQGVNILGGKCLMHYNVAIKDMPVEMRPREKMIARGESSLSDAELLAIILGNGTKDCSAIELANKLLIDHRGLRNLREVSLEELTQEKGIGPAKAVSIKAALELGRRMALVSQQRYLIHSPEDVKNLVMEEMRYFDREHFRVLYLDRKGGLILWEDVSVGGLHSSIVHPREVFKTAVKRSAASMILVHNHPSGDPSPSREDVEVSKRLIEAGQVMGIEVLDHVVIGESSYCSLKEQALI
ncbi:MAG: DNA repair protein RadC [Bacillota bacterium]|nr:DNA repair protein RadC [Bacillota bacterium]